MYRYKNMYLTSSKTENLSTNFVFKSFEIYNTKLIQCNAANLKVQPCKLKNHNK